MFRSLLLGGVLLATAVTARASVITSVPLTNAVVGYQYSGIGFIALQDSTLVSFTFENRGQADTVLLIDPLGNILNSVATPAAEASYTATVNWALTAGTQYYLLQSTNSNGMWATYGLATPSNAELQFTDTGIFSFSSLIPSNFDISGTTYWASFSEVVTSTPEPSAFLLAGLPLLLLWRTRAVAVVRR